MHICVYMDKKQLIWPNLFDCAKVRQMAQFHKTTNQCAQQSARVTFSNPNVLFVLRKHTQKSHGFFLLFRCNLRFNSYISKYKQKKDSDSSRLTETRIDLADVRLDETETSDADVDEMAEVKHRRRPGGALENLRLADGVAEHIPAPTKQLQEGVERFLQHRRTITDRSLRRRSQLSIFTY